MPIHVGALPWAARPCTEFFAGTISPGDVYLLNDPYHGGNHLPDLTAFVPVFDGDQLLFWSINRSHQSDIGGATHGAYNPGATEIWQEGIRIPPLKLYDERRACARTSRDDRAQCAPSARFSRRSRGHDRLGAARRAPAAGAARRVRRGDGARGGRGGAGRRRAPGARLIAGWKDGVYEGEAFLDDDGHGREDIHIRARVTKRAAT